MQAVLGDRGWRPRPSQKTGIEIPIRARIISSGSQIDPLQDDREHARSAMLNTTQITAAPMTSENVTGAAVVIAGTTFSAWLP